MGNFAHVYRWHEKKFDACLSVILGLVAWAILDSILINNPLVLVGPLRIAEAFTRLLYRGELMRHVYATLVEFALGYFVGVVIGIGLGVLMALSRTVKEVLSPWVTIWYNAPIILLAPLFITALGLGLASKIVIVFIGAVFSGFIQHLHRHDHHRWAIGRGGAGFRWNPQADFFKVIVPGALPLVMTGLRLSVGRALVGAIVSEFFGARAGIGYLITAASEGFRTAEAFVGVVLLAIGGYVTFETLKYVERKIAPWYEYRV